MKKITYFILLSTFILGKCLIATTQIGLVEQQEQSKESHALHKSQNSIEMHSTFSAQDEKQVQNPWESPAVKLDQKMYLHNHTRFSDHANIGTIRDKHTLCEFFRYYDTEFRFKVIYNCVTILDNPDHVLFKKVHDTIGLMNPSKK